MLYLVWNERDPDAAAGVSFHGNTYNKLKSVDGCINGQKMIYSWSEEEFDADHYKDHEVIGANVDADGDSKTEKYGGSRLGGNTITEIIVSGRTAAKGISADNQ